MQSSIKNKNSNKTINESFIRLALVIVLILVQGFLFLNTWIYNYNHFLRFPYVMKGNIFLMLMYMGLSYIFMILFDCNTLSEYRPATLIFSEILSITACNILVYFVIIKFFTFIFVCQELNVLLQFTMFELNP